MNNSHAALAEAQQDQSPAPSVIGNQTSLLLVESHQSNADTTAVVGNEGIPGVDATRFGSNRYAPHIIRGLKLELLQLRKRRLNDPALDQSEETYVDTPGTVELREVNIAGIGRVSLPDIANVMQSYSASDPIREAAFEVIYSAFRYPLTEFLGRTTLSTHPELVNDTVQITLTKVYTKIGLYNNRSRDSFTGWIRTI
ncbi:MAG: hypothetical protein ACREHG_10635, partial [Candidatus Saccharimonadales bacterium]